MPSATDAIAPKYVPERAWSTNAAVATTNQRARRVAM